MFGFEDVLQEGIHIWYYRSGQNPELRKSLNLKMNLTVLIISDGTKLPVKYLCLYSQKYGMSQLSFNQMRFILRYF